MPSPVFQQVFDLSQEEQKRRCGREIYSGSGRDCCEWSARSATARAASRCARSATITTRTSPTSRRDPGEDAREVAKAAAFKQARKSAELPGFRVEHPLGRREGLPGYRGAAAAGVQEEESNSEHLQEAVDCGGDQGQSARAGRRPGRNRGRKKLNTKAITEHDGGRAIVLAVRLQADFAHPRLERPQQVLQRRAVAHLPREVSLELVYWLGGRGLPGDHRAADASTRGATTAIRKSTSARSSRCRTPQWRQASARLGLNLQLLTPQFGPRVLLTAVLCSVDVECDRPMTEALCLGPECGRCLKTCPADAVLEWDRDWERATVPRSPHGFAQLSEYLGRVIDEPDAARKKAMLRSEDSFNLWQSILRGAGVITGCRRCADVCPVGADYEPMLKDALEAIPENTPQKEARLAAMPKGEASPAYAAAGALDW